MVFINEARLLVVPIWMKDVAKSGKRDLQQITRGILIDKIDLSSKAYFFVHVAHLFSGPYIDERRCAKSGKKRLCIISFRLTKNLFSIAWFFMWVFNSFI